MSVCSTKKDDSVTDRKRMLRTGSITQTKPMAGLTGTKGATLQIGFRVLFVLGSTAKTGIV